MYLNRFFSPISFFKIESYWTYEVCHGKHIRQYHEEKETGQVGFVQFGSLNPLFHWHVQALEKVWKMVTEICFNFFWL